MKKNYVAEISKLVLLFVFYILFLSCKSTNNTIFPRNDESVGIEVKQTTDSSVPKEGIPIMAYFGVQEHTIERYRELKECGIDYNFSWFPNVELLAQAMDIANEAEIKMIISCPEMETDPEKTVSRFKDHPALAGYYLSDEPNRNDFPRLGELVRRIQAVDDEHFCYVNLYPNYASSEQLGITSYLEHVQIFIKEVPVPFISFDYYPIIVNTEENNNKRLRRMVKLFFSNSINNGTRSLNGSWYENLEIISNEARNAKKPFWAFALTTAFGPYPIPTFADLRLQVYTNLAYGAQGIQYFTYWTPLPAGIENFHDGPIDYITGKRTPVWYTVQQINREIKGLSDIFLGSQVIQVRHIVKTFLGTNGTVPVGTTRFNFAKRPTEAKIITKFTPANGTSAVVSFLKNGNRCYMVIINRNFDGGSNMSITIKGGAGLQLIKKDGTAVLASSESSTQTITPGDALIYGWDIK